MAKSCNSSEYATQDQKRCCRRCPAGKYVLSDCDGAKTTKCDDCRRGQYTATENHLSKCLVCKDCHSTDHQVKRMECKANEDTQCDCVTGYYCNEPSCDHCRHVTHCPVGEGVKVKATRVNDTICAPCQSGTFSNVSDFTSVCQRHTSCEDNGKVLETPGTSSADAVCGGVTSRCPWMLPTGLVLTSLIVLLAIIIWRTKCKSYKTAFCSFSNAPVDPIPAADVYSVELPLPLTELNDHCQESCLEKDCQPSLFDTDPMMVDSYTLDSAMNDRPVQTGSVHAGKFNNHINGKTENCTTNYLRTHSEPQEDEWRGT